MPAYAKLLKEIFSNKQKVEETSVAKLIEHCSAILQNKLPQKYGDPGRDNREIRSILVSLQLADQTTIIPERIVEVPPILGRPFLATDRAILEIQEKHLILRVGEERVVFKMEGEMRALKE
ncbi:hypothetical protein A4A49_54623 [Nicotiana attenuata]|uniref:Uncharacterized protein n=1 Tax=Nicotiana attenuata TaxID=49451 RepID=A0A1J6JTI7_NICAT|nr:hypothetical protein A4A49_54623 [Nicotiana attenuata]